MVQNVPKLSKRKRIFLKLENCPCSYIYPTPSIYIMQLYLYIYHQVHGDRGHGYFVPAPESKELAGRLDCQGLPVTCADPAACQVGE